MTNSPKKIPDDRLPRRVPSWIYWCAGIVLAALMVGSQFVAHKSHFLLAKPDGWLPSYTYQVSILGTRIVPVPAPDSTSANSSATYYRAEAEVQYTIKGEQHDDWFPASQVTTDHENLDHWLAHKNMRLGLVYWDPSKPNNGIVILKSDVGTPFTDLD